MENIDWFTLLSAIWTVILVPIGRQFHAWLKARQLDRYADILYKEAVNAVKSTYEVYVKDIKGTDGWTSQKQEEVKEIAKLKAVHAISDSSYKMLKAANADFDKWLDSMIGTALYDVKHT